MLVFLRTLSDILTAGIAITAFSLLLYALPFNLRDRVARSFALILIFTVIVYTGEAIGSIETSPQGIDFWLRFQWIGIVFLPAAYLHISDALLSTTGKPSRGRRRWAVRLTYFGSVIFLLGLPVSYLVGPVVYGQPPAPHLQPTSFTNFFIFFYLGVLVISWINFFRAFNRTTTATSRRRMFYLITGALAPALGAFPFLPYGNDFASNHQLTFWAASVLVNLLVGVLLVVMAYAVAFFGVPWPDRVVKTRLFKWLMRGPFTASLTLAVVTLTRRAGETMGVTYSALVPISMVGTVLLSEYLITLFAPMGERLLSIGTNRSELDVLHSLENQMLTRSDLQQFFEMVLAAACDRLQAPGAYIAALNPDGLELVVSTGKTRFSGNSSEEDPPAELPPHVTQEGLMVEYFRWEDDYLFPLLNGTPQKPELIGLLGVCEVAARSALDDEQKMAMATLSARAALALQNRKIQQKIFLSLETLTPQADLIQRLRAASQYDSERLLVDEDNLPRQGDMADWVKDALSHYWGGPKLTQSPLMHFKIVQNAVDQHDGNQANALRSILREAMEKVRPEGERRFTAEWILYNILDMKFLEGRKVREVALRLAMSEADLYRKQRIAIEEVAKVIGEMEVEARKELES